MGNANEGSFLMTMQSDPSSPPSSDRLLSTPALGLVWFGASVSLAEILAGTLFAPLGFAQGILAILIGHVIGCVLFGLVAFIGAKTGKSAMDAVKISFGKNGSIIFSLANVVQLLGWTAIMVAAGAAAAAYLIPQLGMGAWALVIGALIVVWIALGTEKMGRIQSIASVALFVLTIVMSVAVFGASPTLAPESADALSFGAAVEMAVAMPLSWLPVVGDYTRSAKHPLGGTVSSTLLYFFGSCWMFIIGLGATLIAGTDDVAALMSSSGLGIVGILVVVFSTVTTTFLDAESAGISATAVFGKLDARICGVAAAIVGTLLAVFAPVGDYTDFLYLIGSIFAPMAAILIADCLMLGNDASERNANWVNIILWLCGFALYRVSIGWDFVLGNTLPVIVIIIAASLAVHAVIRKVAPELERRASASTEPAPIADKK